jgi:hypothetical protein
MRYLDHGNSIAPVMACLSVSADACKRHNVAAGPAVVYRGEVQITLFLGVKNKMN